MIAMPDGQALAAFVCGLLLVPVALIALFKLFGLLGWALNRRGSRTTVAHLGDFMEWVLRFGCQGCRLRYRRPGTKYRIDFEKIVPPTSGGVARFRMILDSEHCSCPEFEVAKAALSRRNIAYEVWNDPFERRQCLFVECGRDAVLATRAAHAIFADAFGFHPDTPLRACHSGEFDIDYSRDWMVGWEPDRLQQDAKRSAERRESTKS